MLSGKLDASFPLKRQNPQQLSWLFGNDGLIYLLSDVYLGAFFLFKPINNFFLTHKDNELKQKCWWLL